MENKYRVTRDPVSGWFWVGEWEMHDDGIEHSKSIAQFRCLTDAAKYAADKDEEKHAG